MRKGAEPLLPVMMSEAWARYLKMAKTSRLAPTEESIHDLRVSIRRLQAIFDLTRLFLPRSHTNKTRRTLKDMRKSLGPLRDVQVQILLASELVNTFPNLLQFQKHLVKRERKAIRRLKNLMATKGARLGSNFSNTVNQSRDLLRMFTRVETERTVIVAIDKAFAAVLERKRMVDRRDTSAIHGLRTRFKRFRYAIEASRPLFPDVPDTQLAVMRYLQQLMGEIQDTELLFEAISQWSRKKKKKPAALTPVYELLANRRRDSIDAFFARIDDIHTFWEPRSRQSKRSTVPVRLVQQ